MLLFLTVSWNFRINFVACLEFLDFFGFISNFQLNCDFFIFETKFPTPGVVNLSLYHVVHSM